MNARTIRRSFLVAPLALAALLAPGTTTAQSTAVPSYVGVIGFNPLGIPFNIFSVEAEGAVHQAFTAVGSVSYTDFGSDAPRWASFELRGRYYPAEVALRGFSMGLGIGVVQFSDRSNNYTGDPNVRPERLSHTSPTISVGADHNWLLGSQRRFLVGGGVGAKRMLTTGDDPNLDVPRAYPTVRFLIGLAF